MYILKYILYNFDAHAILREHGSSPLSSHLHSDSLPPRPPPPERVIRHVYIIYIYTVAPFSGIGLEDLGLDLDPAIKVIGLRIHI